MRFRGKKLIRLILAFVGFAVAVVAAVLIGMWTKNIKEKKTNTQFRNQLSEIVNQYGERTLLEMAGIEVMDIFYSEEGVTIMEGESKSWVFSSDEIINMSVYEKCSPSVVYITTEVDDSVSDFLDVQISNGVGSGFFITADGYIITNNHVVKNASFISVTTSDGRKYNATLVGNDEENDIAVIKVSPESGVTFSCLEFADSDDLVVGQKVIAIGNPYGYDRSISSGIVSGLSRPIRDENGQVLLGMIQTDASINPGNSGGPLLNSKGKVVGICTSIYSSDGTSSGLNFAVDGNSANGSAQDIIRYGKVNRGWIDLVPVQLSQSIVDYASLKISKGILVSQVVPGGLADKAGIKGGTTQVRYGSSIIYLGGDIITSINGYEVSEYGDLFTALSNTRPGNTIDIVVFRGTGYVNLKVELTERTPENVGWINR